MIRFAIILIASSTALGDDLARQPMYKYRYETEDVMKTAASSVPVHGYHLVEGGYYPIDVGHGGLESGGYTGGSLGSSYSHTGYGGSDGFGGGGLHSGLGGGFGTKYTGIGYGGGLDHGLSHGIGVGGGFGRGIGVGSGLSHGIGVGSGLSHGIGIGSGLSHGIGVGSGLSHGVGVGSGLSHGIGIGSGGLGFGGVHNIGGEGIEKSSFSGGKKNVNDEHYESSHGKKGEEYNHGQEGYNKGEVSHKDVKGDSGYYSQIDGGKKLFEDGKEYHGGEHFNKEGKNGEEKEIKQGHKKGHSIKSFKKSHHKDESGKTEEYYDEEHDEGGNYLFDGQKGSFGENGASSFKGGNHEGKFNSGEAKKEGYYENKYLADKADADHGKYGHSKYGGSGVLYGVKNGEDEQSLLGHQESNKYYKHHPFVVPFHHHY